MVNNCISLIYSVIHQCFEVLTSTHYTYVTQAKTQPLACGDEKVM